MKRPCPAVIASLAALTVWLCLGSIAVAAARQPNVILIVSDDQGYADAGFQGSKEIATPNLDAMAADGVICTQGYVTYPVCSPSRAGFLTGRAPARFGYNTNPDNNKSTNKQAMGLPLSETTLADRMRAAGYVTGLVGKWHLGTQDYFHPLNRGFDHFFGFVGGGHKYMDWKVDPKNTYVAPILKDREPVKDAETRYLTDLLSDQGVNFVEENKDKPFFLYMAYNAPHAPLQASPELLARVPNLNGNRQTYAAMILAVDDGVGRIRTRVRELGLENDTLFVFITDNGGPISANASVNKPLRGEKSQVWEGGIRVPYVMTWKGHLPAGTKYSKPVSTLDFTPTFLAAGGFDVKGMQGVEGVNLLPYLNGKNTAAPHDALFWYQNDSKWAVRKGDWKLINSKDGLQLFNVEQDISEANDASEAHPDVVADLQKTFNQWNASNGTQIPWNEKVIPPLKPVTTQPGDDD